DNASLRNNIQCGESMGQQDRVSKSQHHRYHAHLHALRLYRQCGHSCKAVSTGLVENCDAVTDPYMIETHLFSPSGPLPQLIETRRPFRIADQMARMQQYANL